MRLFKRNPKLTKKEAELLKKAEHEAYFSEKLFQARKRGKQQARKPSFAKGFGKMLINASKEMCKNAREYDKKLEKEFSK